MWELSPRHQIQVQRLNYELEELHKRVPGDLSTMIARTRVKCLLGKRDDAMRLLEGVVAMAKATRESYNEVAVLCGWLGEYGQGREFFDEIVFGDRPNLIGNAARMGLMMGDVAYLRKIRAFVDERRLTDVEEDCGAAALFLDAVEGSDAMDFLPVYLKIVAEHIGKLQCWANPTPDDEEGLVSVTIHYFLNVSSDECRRLDREIFEKASTAAESMGLPVKGLLPYIDVELSAVPKDGLQAVA